MPLFAGMGTVALLAAGQAMPWVGQTTDASSKAAGLKSQARYGELPLSFELNRGQADTGVDFLSRGKGYSIAVTPSGTITSLTKPVAPAKAGEPAAAPESVTLKMNIVGAGAGVRAEGLAKQPGVVNNYVGSDRSKWLSGIPTYGKVSYRDVYPGIDLVYYGAKGGLEYDFVVEPGRDPSAVALSFEGANGLSIAGNGDLVLATPAGDVRQTRPVLYQQIAGERRSVEGSFALRPGNQVGFNVGAFDATRPLVIDPVLDFSTFLGGSANDFGWGIAVDSSGNTYLGGETSSAVFPLGGTGDPPGGVTKPPGQGADAFALKMDPTGNTLLYLTFLGGSNADSANDLALDPSGNVYLTGSTRSGTAGTAFPTLNAFDTTCGTDGLCNGLADSFVAKLDPSGALAYSTFLGGSDSEWHAPSSPFAGAAGIAVRGNRAYVHGSTFSVDFPTTASGVQTSCNSCGNGLTDGYLSVVKTSLAGMTSLSYSTYVGGDGEEQGKDVAVDSTGNAYVTGIAVSENSATYSGFPGSPAYKGGYSDAYAVKIRPSGPAATGLLYSKFIGGGGLEEGWGITVNATNNAYVTGHTTSGAAPDIAAAGDPKSNVAPFFPTTAGAYSTVYAGRGATDSGSTLYLEGDAFVTELKPGGGVLRSTFLGGPASDYGQEITLDSAGDVYVTGWTTCRVQDDRATAFPTSEEPAQYEIINGNQVATGRTPGNSHVTGVGDCDGGSPGSPSMAAGVFPQVGAVTPAVPGTHANGFMNATYLGFELHNSPTGVFVTKLDSTLSTATYSVLLDGPGFDRGFAIAVNGSGPTAEAYVTGRTGRVGYPISGSPGGTGTAYDSTYNGAGRDTFISKLVG